MNQIIQALIAHQVLATMIGARIVIAVVASMPEPRPMGSQAYQFIYTLGHTFAGDIQEGLKNLKPK